MSAQILPFVFLQRPRASDRDTKTVDSERAVIILPCVRYERWDDGDARRDACRQANGHPAVAHH